MSLMREIFNHGTQQFADFNQEQRDQFWFDLTAREVRHLFRPMNQRIEETGFDRFRLTKEEVDELIKHYCARVGDIRISEYLYSSSVRMTVIVIIHGALCLKQPEEIQVDFVAKCLELVKKYDDKVTCWM